MKAQFSGDLVVSADKLHVAFRTTVAGYCLEMVGISDYAVFVCVKGDNKHLVIAPNSKWAEDLRDNGYEIVAQVLEEVR